MITSTVWDLISGKAKIWGYAFQNDRLDSYFLDSPDRKVSSQFQWRIWTEYPHISFFKKMESEDSFEMMKRLMLERRSVRKYLNKEIPIRNWRKWSPWRRYQMRDGELSTREPLPPWIPNPLRLLSCIHPKTRQNSENCLSWITSVLSTLLPLL